MPQADKVNGVISFEEVTQFAAMRQEGMSLSILDETEAARQNVEGWRRRASVRLQSAVESIVASSSQFTAQVENAQMFAVN